MNLNDLSYSPRERFWLVCLAVFAFVGLNGTFLYGLFFQPDAMVAAQRNPIAMAFMLEAFVLMGVLAYLLPRWGVTSLHWGWFIALSIAGGIAFALPVALLWGPARSRPRSV